MSIQSYVHVEQFEEYKERFKDFAYLERSEDGVLFCRLHWKGGPVLWSYQTQHAYGELWSAIGHDKKNEVMILTCTDPYWLCHESDPASFDEVEQSGDTSIKYNVNIPDTMNFVENFINDIEIPVIAAINGQGMHYEFALMADITLCFPEFVFSDQHFSKSMVCGDGMAFAYRVCAGVKRSSYMMYMEPKIDAETALQYGLVNEIVPHDQLIDRAYQIAAHIMKSERTVRRLVHEITMRPWKRALQDDERVNVLCEMYSVQLLKSEHHFDQIVSSFDAEREQF
ncbi:MAG: enoyl-CoA hydratase/isomerase family protein [Lachnospiraceae bacterium]|nr:enoyl-CoA hydratase/isomerase family protein [Lachnospiraceae bacterium]